MSNSDNNILSEKDLNSMKSFVKLNAIRGPMRNSLQDRQLIVQKHASPASSCRIESDSGEDDNRKQRNQPEKKEKENINAIGAGEDYVDENDDGFRTPTSLDQKLPAMCACPPPPRKAKPAQAMKRRAPRRRVLLDLSNEIELLFPPAVMADLGNNIKKMRQ